MAEALGTYDAVVVHYDDERIYGVVATLAAQTRRPRRVLLVDNSDSLNRSRLPATVFPVQVVGPAHDHGYAAAVNLARRHWVDPAPMLLVLTHDVILDADCAEALMGAADGDATVGSVGPVLRTSSDETAVFSTGGTLDGAAWPRHRTALPPTGAIDATWIDGSVMLLRRTALDEAGWLDEGYFLYFEEVDLALRLRRTGWRVVVAGEARARQTPGAYPPFLALRNRILLVRAFPDVLRMPYPIFLLRLLAEIVWVARRRGPASVRPSVAGWAAGVVGRRGRP